MRSIANMVESLGDEFRFRIVTSDRDFNGKIPYPDIPSDGWNKVGRAEVCYLPPGYRSFAIIDRLIRQDDYDCIYLNSFFNPRFSILPLAIRNMSKRSKRLVIAPRGEFASAALSLKAFKKRTFLDVSRLIKLHEAVTWHASSEHEAEDIRKVMGSAARDIRLAAAMPMWIPNPVPLANERQPGGPLRIIFLARVVPMKNLLFALEILAQVQAPVVFAIYGPLEDKDYWARCSAAIARLPANISVYIHGEVPQEQVAQVLGNHDLFFLPTLGENFGHSIAEALGAGLRILISDRTMWRDLKSEGVGNDLALDLPGAFVEAIEEEATVLRGKEQTTHSRNYLARKLNLTKLRAASIDLFSV